MANIFAGIKVVVAAAVVHSPGLPEMNPSISLCHCVSVLRGSMTNCILALH